MNDIALIHGAWHGGWCWDDTAAALRVQGWRVACPDLPDAPDTTLEQAVDVLPPARLILGHSMGGILAEALATRQSPKALIHLCSYLPLPGDSLATLDRLLPSPPRAWPRDDQGRLILPPAEARAMMLHDVDAQVAADALDRMRPQPTGPMRAPCPGPRAVTTRHYILCRADRAIAPALQRAMLTRAPVDHLHQTDWGHAPFLSDPAGLARLIDAIAAHHLPPP